MADVHYIVSLSKDNNRYNTWETVPLDLDIWISMGLSIPQLVERIKEEATYRSFETAMIRELVCDTFVFIHLKHRPARIRQTIKIVLW